MAAGGTLTLGGKAGPGHRTAWFDHEWGDFIAVGGGGWDWYAINLSDGTDLMLSLVRDADGSYPLVYGTIVDAAGHDAVVSTATRAGSGRTGHRTSPVIGATWTSNASRSTIPGRASTSVP